MSKQRLNITETAQMQYDAIAAVLTEKQIKERLGISIKSASNYKKDIGSARLKLADKIEYLYNEVVK